MRCSISLILFSRPPVRVLVEISGVVVVVMVEIVDLVVVVVGVAVVVGISVVVVGISND